MTTVRKIVTPFASGGDYNEIPDGVQTTGTVSNTEGFGYNYQRNPDTDPLAQNIQRQDMNGILHDITAALQWLQINGAPMPYDAAYQGSIGGYPSGALVQSAATPGLVWQSTAVANASNPDAGGGGWVQAWTRPSDLAAVIAAAVAAEASRAEGIESSLQTAISAEVLRAEAAEAGLLGQIPTAVTPSVALIATTGSWTAPTTGWYEVEGLGGGGGGGASSGSGQTGSGGSAGSRFRDLIQLTAGQTVAVTIGAGGAPGGNGGATSFGSRTAGGGVFGQGSGGSTAAVGSGFGGASSGAALGIGGDSSAPSGLFPSNGGSSPYGTGGVFTFAPGSGAPTPGDAGGYGAGGSGGYGGGAGGHGTQGLVIARLVGA